MSGSAVAGAQTTVTTDLSLEGLAILELEYWGRIMVSHLHGSSQVIFISQGHACCSIDQKFQIARLILDLRPRHDRHRDVWLQQVVDDPLRHIRK